MFRKVLITCLTEPSTRGLDLDDWRLTDTRRSILQQKKFLRAIYTEWYQVILKQIPYGSGSVVELGSGAGFFEEYYSKVIKSEIFWLKDIDLAMDGCALPFQKETLKAIVMTDVLHHIPCVRDFFKEATRCLSPGGVVVMVEPWSTAWSRWVYNHLHHELFEPSSPRWEFDTTGPLSGANGALPWMIFERDKSIFTHEFPLLQLKTIQLMMPFRYLISGGLSMRGLVPTWSVNLWKLFELRLKPWHKHLCMFALIVLKRKVEIDDHYMGEKK